MEKYVNSNTIIKNEVYEAFKDSIICPFCSNLIIEPVICFSCQETFCKNCYKKIEVVQKNVKSLIYKM